MQNLLGGDTKCQQPLTISTGLDIAIHAISLKKQIPPTFVTYPEPPTGYIFGHFGVNYCGNLPRPMALIEHSSASCPPLFDGIAQTVVIVMHECCDLSNTRGTRVRPSVFRKRNGNRENIEEGEEKEKSNT